MANFSAKLSQVILMYTSLASPRGGSFIQHFLSVSSPVMWVCCLCVFSIQLLKHPTIVLFMCVWSLNSSVSDIITGVILCANLFSRYHIHTPFSSKDNNYLFLLWTFSNRSGKELWHSLTIHSSRIYFIYIRKRRAGRIPSFLFAIPGWWQIQLLSIK